jgi:hypothetical protein
MRSIVRLIFVFGFSILFVLLVSFSPPAVAVALALPQVEFLDLSPCHEDSSFHAACRWISGRFRAWPEGYADLVRNYLSLDSNLNARSMPKLKAFYDQLRGAGLAKIQFVYSDKGLDGDQAETTMDGKVAIIALRPGFFASHAVYGAVSEQQHVLIHELFHVFLNLTVGGETPNEPFWRDLARSLEWRSTGNANALIDMRLKKEALTRSRADRARGEWDRAVETDLGFSRSVGFPSLYGMSRLSEYVPELGSFLVHDGNMAGVLPRDVWDVIRRSPLGFLLATEPRPAAPMGEGVRMEAVQVEHQFVGMLFDQNRFVCTVFVLRHGLAITSKACLNPSWPIGGHPGVRYSFLSLEFPRVADDGPPVRVDGMQIAGLIPDSGLNDFVYITYEAKLTEGRLVLPSLKLMRDSNSYGAEISKSDLFTLGFALPAKPRHLRRLRSGICHAYARDVSPPFDRSNFNRSNFRSDCPGWTGSAGLPILSMGEREGQFIVWGIVSEQPNLNENGVKTPNYRVDSWGRFVNVGFSPTYLMQDLQI